MARPSTSKRLVQRAEAALMAAIEIYNKPDFPYREETFAILAINAWELLLKARVVALEGNEVRSLYVYQPRRDSQGNTTKKLFVRRNRSGNPMTIGLSGAIDQLDGDSATRIPLEVKANLEALTEIRDNAVHFVAVGPRLAKEVLEVGTATVKNFIELATKWFQTDFSRYKLYLMPIGFLTGPPFANAVVASPEERNVFDYLSKLVADSGSGGSGFHVALEVNLAFKKAQSPGAILVVPSKDPSATPVTLTEENIRTGWPWDYRELTKRLRSRYTDFLENDKYHRVRKPLDTDERYARIRYLDPARKNSGSKCFYNSNIFSEFDKHYTRR